MKATPESVRKELAALAAQPESTIDFSDVPATTKQDWQNATRGKFYRPIKQQLTVRIDSDVIEWLKNEAGEKSENGPKGKGYQSRLNDILRAAMLEKARH